MNFREFLKKIVNLGVFARGLLVVVKPLSLWASIQIDFDNGVALAQIFLIGMLFVSISGTNAHRKFYEVKFGKDSSLSHLSVTKSLIGYLNQITLQLFLIVTFATMASIFLFPDTFEVVRLGIIFGIAEKINDEYQRHAQFCNNSQQLFVLALIKFLAAVLAISLSFFQLIDIWISFPSFLLAGTLILNYATINNCLRVIAKKAKKSVLKLVLSSFIFIKNDLTQIGWVFTCMSLMSIDKWLVQYLAISHFPKYMLCTQIASIAQVAQTIFLIAPARVRLINENPYQIKSLKIGTPIISAISVMIGVSLFFYNPAGSFYEHIEYFAFFLAAVLTYSTAYTERLYWVASPGHRILLDIVVILVLTLAVGFGLFYFDMTNIIFWSLSLLVIMLLLRLLVIMILLPNNKGDGNVVN